MSIPTWIVADLDGQGVAYRTSRHKKAIAAESVAAREHVLNAHFGKVVVAIADGKPVLLVIPAASRIDPVTARIATSTRDLRLATEDEIAQLLPDADVGATPPLRHWEGVEIWADPALGDEGEFVFQAGTHEDAIHMDFADWKRVARPRIGALIHPTFIGA